MPETTTVTEPRPEPLPEAPNVPLDPSDILMSLIVALLAPMFLGVTADDIRLARLAAIETVLAYRTRNQADLIAVAQIIAYGLAALGSLSLSMADDITLSMALRLRSNANALGRSAEQNRRALRASHDNNPTRHPLPEDIFPRADLRTETEAFLSPLAAQVLAAEAEARLQEPQGLEDFALPAVTPVPGVPEKRNQEMWAIAMVNEASKLNATIHTLPPAERESASLRIATLSSTANQLLTGVHPMPSSPDGLKPPNTTASP